MKAVSLNEVRRHGCYDDMAELAGIFNREIVEDDSWVWRWKSVAMTKHLHENRLDLNRVWLDFHEGAFPVEDLMRFHMDAGCSLAGFIDLFGQDEAGEWGLPGALRKPADHDEGKYFETPIQYVIRMKRGS